MIYTNQSPFTIFSTTGYVATGYNLGGTSQSPHCYISNNGLYMIVTSFGDYTSTTQTNGYSKNYGLNWNAMSGYYNGSNYTINRYCYMSRTGQYIITAIRSATSEGGIYISNDYGATLTQSLAIYKY